MVKSEFIFKLSDQIFYHKSGDAVYVNKLILKAPTVKNRYYTTCLKQTLMQAIKDTTPQESSDQSGKNKISDSDNVIDATGICALLMMSKVDLNACYENLKAILLNGCAFVDKEMGLNELLYDQICDDDIELILGEYISNFLIPSWMKRAMKQ